MKILNALIKKEFKQIFTDPSSIIISFILPFISIMIYMYGVNLDSVKVTIGIKNDDASPEVATLVKSYGHSKYIKSIPYDNQKEIESAISRSEIRGAIIIPNDFSKKLSKGEKSEILVITDGSEVNTANYIPMYAQSVANNWLSTNKFRGLIKKPLIDSELRVWYNQDLNSHYFILPGQIAVTMTMTGILLTALVVAREWETGTMESLLSTNVKRMQLVLSKYIPYFILGTISMIFTVFMCIIVFRIPFRGNIFVLFGVSAMLLTTLLGTGLLISSKLKNRFLASQVSVTVGFLPALLLSGLIYPINSMPKIFQYITAVMPQRYFITFVESEFMAGTLKEVVITNTLILFVTGLLFFALVYISTDMRADK